MPRSGIASRELLILLALAGLIGVLMQVQSGALDLSALAGQGSAPSSSKPKKAGKSQPTLIPSDPKAGLYGQAADTFIAQRQMESAKLEHERLRVLGGLALADSTAAANLLAKMDPVIAAKALGALPRRSIARILEDAPPETAMAWASALLAEPQPVTVPAELKDRVAKAGLYNNLDDLLAAIRGEPEKSEGTVTGAEAADSAGSSPAAGTPASPP